MKEAGYRHKDRRNIYACAKKIIIKLCETPWGMTYYTEYENNKREQRREQCIVNKRARNKKRRYDNREKELERSRRYYLKNKEAISIKKQKLRAEGFYKDRDKGRYTKHREINLMKGNIDTFLLKDNYIKSHICINSDLSFSDIPNEIVELYRLKLRLKRLIHKTKLKGEAYVEHPRIEGSAVESNCEVAER